jgi:hypothetical protein
LERLFKIKSTLRAIIPDCFCLESIRASYFFFNSKEKVTKKMPPLLKVLNRKKWLILGSRNNVPSGFRSNGILAICP